MKNNANKKTQILSIAILSSFILSGSVFTTNAIENDVNQSTNDIAVVEPYEKDIVIGEPSEYEICNGDVIVSQIKNFDIQFEVKKANNVNIDNCGENISVAIAEGTVGSLLSRLGIILEENQSVYPTINTVIKGDTDIKIYNAINLNVTVGKTMLRSRVPENVTVAEALQISGYELSADDVVNVDLKSIVKDNMNIVINRVTYDEETITKEIDYKIITRNSDELYVDETEVYQKGVEGKKSLTYKNKYVDGKKVSSELIDEKILSKPVDKIILEGTKARESSDNSGDTFSYSNVITGSGTAYTAPSGALTATGVRAGYGYVAVNPNIIPYGTQLYITSTDGSFVYGYAIAADTGGALMSGSAIVDLYFDSYDECVNFGRRDVNIYIIG